jgi:hypothetical protein
MPSLGSMDFPETTISDAAELAKKIAQSFRTNEFSKESLAAALGYKNAVSGAFNQRLADLRKYGIVEGRGDRLRATNLSQRLAAPAPGEYEHSIQEMLEAIPLFRALHEHFAGSLPGEEDFFVTLLNITGADRLAVKDMMPKIRGTYSDAINRIGPRGSQSAQERVAARSPASSEQPGRGSQATSPNVAPSMSSPTPTPGRYVMSGDEWSISIAQSMTALEAVKTLVDALLAVEKAKAAAQAASTTVS